MDERRRRAWAALGLGPTWVLRDPPRSVHEAEPTRPPADGPDSPPDAALPGATDPIEVARSRAPSSRRDPLIAALDWTALADAVADCRACGLCEGRRRTVFGLGPRPASWMWVGEAPGEQEDLQGEPFVGPAGRLLEQMLGAIGIDRGRDAYITNVLKCRPPSNRDPLPQEVASCSPYLLRQAELLRPRLIVVLGRFAARSLLQTDASIASLRGRVHACRVGDREVPVIVTYHPAYLLRNLPDKAKSWADLRLARRTWEALG
jgi:DNA polymerase